MNVPCVVMGCPLPGIPFGVEVNALVGHGSRLAGLHCGIVPFLQYHPIGECGGPPYGRFWGPNFPLRARRIHPAVVFIRGPVPHVGFGGMFCTHLHQDFLNCTGPEWLVVHGLQVRSVRGRRHHDFVCYRGEVTLEPQQDSFIWDPGQQIVSVSLLSRVLLCLSSTPCAFTHDAGDR